MEREREIKYIKLDKDDILEILLEQLNEFGTGWKKVYQNGWIDGQKVSYHYFQDATGKIFDFAAHYGKWS